MHFLFDLIKIQLYYICMGKLNILYKECLTELESIGIGLQNKDIELKLSKRNNKRYGCCKPKIPDEN